MQLLVVSKPHPPCRTHAGNGGIRLPGCDLIFGACGRVKRNAAATSIQDKIKCIFYVIQLRLHYHHTTTVLLKRKTSNKFCPGQWL